MVTRNDDPPDSDEAHEEKIDGVWYAWTEDDHVFMQDPTSPLARDDGYVFIGHIVWPENLPYEFDSRTLLREFVKNRNQGEAQ